MFEEPSPIPVSGDDAAARTGNDESTAWIELVGRERSRRDTHRGTGTGATAATGVPAGR